MIDEGCPSRIKATGQTAAYTLAPFHSFRPFGLIAGGSLVGVRGRYRTVLAIRALRLSASGMARLWSITLKLLIRQGQAEFGQAATHTIRFAAGMPFRGAISSIHNRH